ncbi:MAG: SDR family oxidoreductase [Elusimicrobia bacterium]|nr:SDR family oxidoreductase [Elusimicrobiota bacterium]
MRVIIVGATGLLGHALFRHLSCRAGWEVFATTYDISVQGFEPLDALDAGAVERVLDRVRPEAVVFPASNPYVDYCEKRPEETRRLNVDATLACARKALGRGLRFVFFSTDYVFDGKKLEGYREEDEPRPLNEYGRQKLEVERALCAEGGRHLILRTSAIFGWELQPKNFVLQVLARLKDGRKLKAPLDLDYNPTYAPDLAEGIADLLEKGAQGLYHLAGSEHLTRADFAKKAAQAFGLDASRIDAVPAASLSGPGATPRPLHTSLISEKAQRLLGRRLPGASEALESMRSSAAEWKEYAGRLLTSSGGTP